MAKNNAIQKTGRRKTSVARATLVKGSGKITVNNEPIESYISSDVMVLKAKEAILISDNEGKFDFKINVFGGGVSSQVDAIRQAIARAIVEVSSEDIRKKFIEYDRSLIVSDTRFKEMKKPNNSHARAKRQKSYR